MDPTQPFGVGLITGFIIAISTLALFSHHCDTLQHRQFEQILEAARTTVTVTAFITPEAEVLAPSATEITSTNPSGIQLAWLFPDETSINRLLAGIQYVFSRVAMVFLVLLALGVIRLGRHHLIRIWDCAVGVWEVYHKELSHFDCYE